MRYRLFHYEYQLFSSKFLSQNIYEVFTSWYNIKILVNCFIFFQCCIPDPNELRNFVIKPQLPENTRLHCTMIRHNEKTAKNNTGNGTTSAASLSENSSNNNTTSTSNESEAEKLGQTSAYTLYLGKKKPAF